MKIVNAVIKYVQKIKTFRSTVKEWLGEGGAPVSHRQAQARADKCAECPFNRHSGNTGSELIPSLVMRRIEVKAKIKLFVENEWQLSTCRICSCYLPLKVHVPIIHIRQFMPQSMVDKIRELKPDCWQITEKA